MPQNGTNQPNVIVFFTDQQRWDTSGLHGNPLDLMPNFDRMAQRGHMSTALLRANRSADLPAHACKRDYTQLAPDASETASRYRRTSRPLRTTSMRQATPLGTSANGISIAAAPVRDLCQLSIAVGMTIG